MSSVLTTLKTDDINRLNRARLHTDGEDAILYCCCPSARLILMKGSCTQKYLKKKQAGEKAGV